MLRPVKQNQGNIHGRCHHLLWYFDYLCLCVLLNFLYLFGGGVRENPRLSLCSVRGLKYNKTAAAKVSCLCVHRNEISVMFAELFLYLMHGSETRVIRVTHVIKSHTSLPLKSLLSFPRRNLPSHPDLQRRPSPALLCGAPCCQPGSPGHGWPQKGTPDLAFKASSFCSDSRCLGGPLVPSPGSRSPGRSGLLSVAGFVPGTSHQFGVV